jgi:hypothetical protein
MGDIDVEDFVFLVICRDGATPVERLFLMCDGKGMEKELHEFRTIIEEDDRFSLGENGVVRKSNKATKDSFSKVEI